MKKIIFDIGAHEGQDSIPLARESSNTIIYAFEPVPALAKRIKDETSELPNYNLITKAVSDYTGNTTFNIINDGTGGQSSLLKFNDQVDVVWPSDTFRFTDEIPVKVIRLDDFIKEKDIKKIDYLHIDAQGSDLSILRGMGEYINIVEEGVVEASNTGRECYESQNNREQTIQYLKDKNFTITQVISNDDRGNEVNIYFTNNFKM